MAAVTSDIEENKSILQIRMIGNSSGSSQPIKHSLIIEAGQNFIVPENMNIHAINIVSGSNAGIGYQNIDFGGLPLVTNEMEPLSFTLSTEGAWTVGVTEPKFSEEIMEKAWKFCEEIMGVEQANALKNGESLVLRASNDIRYQLKPTGEIVNLENERSYCLQIDNEIGRLPLPDILATKYMWITLLPNEVEKRSNKFPTKRTVTRWHSSICNSRIGGFSWFPLRR